MLINQTFKCGHTCKIDIRGRAAQREARQRQLNRRLCPECMQPVVLEYEASHKLAPLADNYARCLRYEQLKEWGSFITPALRGGALHYFVCRDFDKAAVITNPAFWIKNQTYKRLIKALN